MPLSLAGRRPLLLALLCAACAGAGAAAWQAPLLRRAKSSELVPIAADRVARYGDGRPAARLRLTRVTDLGVVLAHGDGPGGGDLYGARDVWVYEAGGAYYMHYDAAGPAGWIANLATSTDLRTWRKQGPILELGAAGAPDAASASYATTFQDGRTWRAFYLGTPNATPAPERVPQFPYLTLRAVSDGPAGPWRKAEGPEPFTAVPGTYYSVTASPGHVVRTEGTARPGSRYRQFFAAAALEGNKTLRTLGIARTDDLDGRWTVDARPILPPSEQVENSSLYYQEATRTWFLFTNHVGVTPEGVEFTDAIWVYWSPDLDRWDPANKAVVLDGASSTWSKGVIGLPSVVPTRDGRQLAVFYDGRREDAATELEKHMFRDIGLALIQLPIRLP